MTCTTGSITVRPLPIHDEYPKWKFDELLAWRRSRLSAM